MSGEIYLGVYLGSVSTELAAVDADCCDVASAYLLSAEEPMVLLSFPDSCR